MTKFNFRTIEPSSFLTTGLSYNREQGFNLNNPKLFAINQILHFSIILLLLMNLTKNYHNIIEASDTASMLVTYILSTCKFLSFFNNKHMIFKLFCDLRKLTEKCKTIFCGISSNFSIKWFQHFRR